jgi:hypothetical protein
MSVQRGGIEVEDDSIGGLGRQVELGCHVALATVHSH